MYHSVGFVKTFSLEKLELESRQQILWEISMNFVKFMNFIDDLLFLFNKTLSWIFVLIFVNFGFHWSIFLHGDTLRPKEFGSKLFAFVNNSFLVLGVLKEFFMGIRFNVLKMKKRLLKGILRSIFDRLHNIYVLIWVLAPSGLNKKVTISS